MTIALGILYFIAGINVGVLMSIWVPYIIEKMKIRALD